MNEIKNRKRSYKYCFFDDCESTTISTPKKIFVPIPKGDDRQIWVDIIKPNKTFSDQSSLYCCEDHFNVNIE